MILLTGLYEESDPRRRDEFLECLRRNAENELLDEIHLFLEEPAGPDRPSLTSALPGGSKIRVIAHGRRLTFQELFAYANQRLCGQRVVFANADIFLNHTLARLDKHDLSNKLLCLTRWDVLPDGSLRFFNHPASQDAWIFQTPIREFPCDFHLGLPCCDNRLAWEAEHAGLEVSNPSRSVQACHMHLSGIRRYDYGQLVAGPIRGMLGTFLTAPRPAPAAPCAAVAFREEMGYAVARLETGVSSHTNVVRPFREIPELLRGKPFTQAVAWSAAPVQVEFLSPGKLYVLAGNDWYGYFTATCWLSETGYRESLPLIETQCETGFEVWSLVADAGKRFLIPTQVMLVAESLIRK